MSKISTLLDKIERPKLELINEEVIIVKESAPLHPLYVLAMSGELYFQDPRPDLEDDSMLWLQMLAEAYKFSKQLQENLWGMRNWGTRLIKGRKGFVLRADVDEDGMQAWPDLATYEKWRDRLLVPYKPQIAEILKRLFEWEVKSGE